MLILTPWASDKVGGDDHQHRCNVPKLRLSYTFKEYTNLPVLADEFLREWTSMDFRPLAFLCLITVACCGLLEKKSLFRIRLPHICAEVNQLMQCGNRLIRPTDASSKRLSDLRPIWILFWILVRGHIPFVNHRESWQCERFPGKLDGVALAIPLIAIKVGVFRYQLWWFSSTRCS